jgi:hypothetical protein
MKRLTPMAVVAFAILAARPALAQVDFSGKWSARNGQDVMERGFGPELVDYLGLPLNDEGRARALAFNYSAVSLPESQCGYWMPFYLVTGPFGLDISTERDEVTGRIIAWKIGAWIDRDATTIWMDGRRHPSPHARHLTSGFTTGRWEGTMLVATTTHMKAGTVRRNGAPVSDRATMTTYFSRHGDLLTITAWLDDPVYFTEPLVRSRVWELNRVGNMGNGQPAPCEPVSELPRADVGGIVPHYLPGQNPYVNELTRFYNLPLEAVLGGAETMYPEFQKRLKDYVAPALCRRYCGCGGLGVPCITDGSGIAR